MSHSFIQDFFLKASEDPNSNIKIIIKVLFQLRWHQLYEFYFFCSYPSSAKCSDTLHFFVSIHTDSINVPTKNQHGKISPPLHRPAYIGQRTSFVAQYIINFIILATWTITSCFFVVKHSTVYMNQINNFLIELKWRDAVLYP